MDFSLLVACVCCRFFLIMYVLLLMAIGEIKCTTTITYVFLCIWCEKRYWPAEATVVLSPFSAVIEVISK